jgi:hypothetical protein
MKCIIKGSDIKKVKDVEAKSLVANDGWTYCKRSLWKSKVRDIGGKKSKEVEVVAVKTDTTAAEVMADSNIKRKGPRKPRNEK